MLVARNKVLLGDLVYLTTSFIYVSWKSTDGKNRTGFNVFKIKTKIKARRDNNFNDHSLGSEAEKRNAENHSSLDNV